MIFQAFAAPQPATRDGDVWTVNVLLPEGRYVYIWRVDGTTTPDELALRDAEQKPGNAEARAGVLVVRPVRRLPDAIRAEPRGPTKPAP